jgi:hypothetical protein
MTVELEDQLDGAPELRLACYAFSEEFKRPPAGVWQAPGSLTLLANGRLRLKVPTRWGAIVAASPRPDEVIEPFRVNRPDEERALVTVGQAAAGDGPAWIREGLMSARCGATLLINVGLPEGSGVETPGAVQAAVSLALRDLAPARSGGGGPAGAHPGPYPAGTALLGGERLPFDPAAAGLRLMLIDTRVRGDVQVPEPEFSPMGDIRDALETGALEALGPMLTQAHAAQAADEAQDLAVSAALGAGAIGARMLTDGPGRPVCALLHAPRLPDVRAAVAAAFADRQLRAPRFLTVSPSPGPRGYLR